MEFYPHQKGEWTQEAGLRGVARRQHRKGTRQTSGQRDVLGFVSFGDEGLNPGLRHTKRAVTL